MKEWSRVLAQYQGPTDAWKKVKEILPEDDATVRIFVLSTTIFSHSGVCRSFSLLELPAYLRVCSRLSVDGLETYPILSQLFGAQS